MKYNFDEDVNRAGSGCTKWDGMEQLFGKKSGLLPFWIADMDMRTAPEVIEELRKAVDHGVFGYAQMSDDARTAVADWERQRHGWDVSCGDVGFVPGVVNGLIAAVIEFTEPGDKIVLQPPVYPPFYRAITDNGRIVAENRLVETKDGWRMDLDDLREKFKSGAKALMLCSPHNPVARVWSERELKDLASVCSEYDITIFSDEIHQDLVYSDAKHIPLSAAAPEIDSKLVTLVAPSKTFNIPGLSASAWIAKDKTMADRMRRGVDVLHESRLNVMGVTALKAAYTKGGPWRDELLTYLEGTRDMFERYIREEIPRVKLLHPEGTFIFWLDFRDYGLSDKELQRVLIDKAGVALNPGRTFGEQGEGFARFNIGCPRARVQEGLERIKRAFA